MWKLGQKMIEPKIYADLDSAKKAVQSFLKYPKYYYI
jgi:hypothetical protein